MTVDCIAYIGLGSNLHKPVKQVAKAIELLRNHTQIEVLACSSFYSSAPMGEPYQGQPDYINAAIKVKTQLSPRALLDALLATEKGCGRNRDIAYSARTLDLDLLLYADRELNEPGLVVPHPRMHERAFVLEPLFEIEPALVIPGKGPVAVFRELCLDQSLTMLETA